ncbi:MAG: arylamine N-acetyltransferase family protein [Candidatus Pararuminococcus gallinarum]|jgi:N-hydroxyarylamine O-acetyltransferase
MAWSRNMSWTSYYEIPENLCSLYLRRLGTKKKEPTRAYLDELVYLNQIKIPFENLDTTLWSEPVSIEPTALVHKILLENRGGFCFELNGIFSLLLQSLGFDAHMCPCRQLRHHEPCPVPATHCGILVNLEGQQLFCDVGYGGPVPRGSMVLKTDVIQSIGKEYFYLKNSAELEGWLTLYRKSSNPLKADLSLVQIAPISCYLCDFYGQTMLRSQGPSAYEEMHAAIKMNNGGFANLQNYKLRVKVDDKDTMRIVSDEEFPLVLQKYFGIMKNKHSERT